MNCIDFDNLVKQRFENCSLLLKQKGIEYSSAYDRFHSFKNGYKISLCSTPESYAWSLLSKHLQSIVDMINHMENGFNGFPQQSVIDEKFSDAHNYLLFIEGLITEKINREGGIPEKK